MRKECLRNAMNNYHLFFLLIFFFYLLNPGPQKTLKNFPHCNEQQICLWLCVDTGVLSNVMLGERSIGRQCILQKRQA